MDIELLKTKYNIDVQENVLGGTISSFRSGGVVKHLFTPHDVEGLNVLLKNIENYHILGRGTNVIISDLGVENIISLKGIRGVKINGDEMIVCCGESLINIANIARDNCLTGLERLSGIPGSIGGAICMNAGAYDAEIGDKVIDITILSGDIVKTITKKEAKFRYRGSVVLDNKDIVLSVRLKLNYGDKEDIVSEMRRVKNKRLASQPTEPSVGSTFLKVDGLSAGAYIDALGLKGLKIGGAMVSEKHSGFIVNTGLATTADYLSLVEVIEQKVRCAYGINLRREFIYIGD